MFTPGTAAPAGPPHLPSTPGYCSHKIIIIRDKHHFWDEVTTETSSNYENDVLTKVSQRTSGPDNMGHDLNINTDFDIQHGKVSLTVNGKEVYSADLPADIKSALLNPKSGDWIKALDTFSSDLPGPVKIWIKSFLGGETLDDFAKDMTVAYLTIACQGATAATGNPAVAAAGVLGCGYLAAWITDQAWPETKKIIDDLIDLVPGLRSAAEELYGLAKSALNTVEKGIKSAEDWFASL
jgi:hypothetical protein